MKISNARVPFRWKANSGDGLSQESKKVAAEIRKQTEKNQDVDHGERGRRWNCEVVLRTRLWEHNSASESFQGSDHK